MPDNEEVSTTEFKIRFEGPALDGHSMQVRDLAPALMALGESLNVIATITEPSAVPPGLAIKAAEPGSFEVLLQLADPSVFHRMQDLLIGDVVGAVLNAKELLITLGGSYALVKWLKGRRIKRVEVDTPKPGHVRIVDEQGNSIEVPTAAWTAAQDLRFREAARDAVAPLERDGIEALEIDSGPIAPKVRVDRDDRAAFEVPDVVEKPILDDTHETVLRLVNIAFNEDHKWKVSEGDATFWVQIEDLDFLERVSRGVEVFTAGDLLRVRLRHQQWSTSGLPRSERAVLKVIQHIPGPRQVALPFTEDPD